MADSVSCNFALVPANLGAKKVRLADWLEKKLEPTVQRDSRDSNISQPGAQLYRQSGLANYLFAEPCFHQRFLHFFWWHRPMPQLCLRMQNKAAMPARKTMFFGDKKSLAPQLNKFTKTEHCLGALGIPCTTPRTLATHVGLHGSLQPLLPVLGLATERTGSYKMKAKKQK